MFSRSLLKRAFSTAIADIPKVDTANFLRNGPASMADCKIVAEAFEKTSCLLVRDPRINQSHIDGFIDLMESYFESRSQKYYNGDQNLDDFYPEYNFQTGACPDELLIMQDYKQVMSQYGDNHKPMTTSPPKPDSKWRFLWRVGERIDNPQHFSVDPPVHIPPDYPQWKDTMDKVGDLLLGGVYTVSEMLALGLGLERNVFTKMLDGGPQVLAPNGSDLSRYQPGTSLSAFHYDLNFLTIHGKNRYPGLYIWLRNGEKRKVSVPEGHVLLQVGKQLEMLTGGYMEAGFREVMSTEESKRQAEEAKKQGRSPWRINTTLFASTHPDVILKPLGRFATPEAVAKYPPIRTLEQMEEEFKSLNMTQEKLFKIKARSSPH